MASTSDAADPGTSPSISASRPLRIAALVKQVPMAESLTLGPDGRLDRAGTEHEMNPYCRRAVSKGTELARASGGTCTVFTLGPPAAEDVLREAVAWGAGAGVHLCDPAFAGSDTLATSRALSAALSAAGPFDLVLVGRNTIDGDTGQVGPELAQLLDLPFATGVRELSLDGEMLSLRLEHDDGFDEVSVALPVVLSVAERLTEPAKVDPDGRRAVPASTIRRVTAAELGAGPWGDAGSPTRVGEVRVHRHDRHPEILSGTVAQQVEAAVALLSGRGALIVDEHISDADAPDGGHAASPVRSDAAGTGRLLAVVLEHGRDMVARELVAEAARLSQQVGGRVVVFRPEGAGSADLGALGADEVIELDGEPLAHDIAADMTAWAAANQPWLVLVPSTAFGREVAARTAAALGAGLVGDAIGLESVGGRVVAAKPAFSGALVADITCTSPVQIVTVRPGVLRPPAPAPHSARSSRRALTPVSRVKVLSSVRDDDVEVLARATAVVGLGAGVSPDEYPALEPLRRALGAELAATRKVTDKSWMPRARQVGLTGRSIAPRLYVAIGVSGKFNHLVGVREAGTVLAVNNDPDALVFSHCDVGIVADWHDAVPLLADEIALQLSPSIS